MIVGGLAAGFQGEPRATNDADLVTFLSPEDLTRLMLFAKRRGVRFSAAAIRKGAFSDGFFRMKVAGVQVDFMVGRSAYEFALLSRRAYALLLGIRVPIATPEDVILMKIISGRPQDWQDAKAVLLRHGRRLDTRYLEEWAKSLGVQHGRGRAIRRLAQLRKMVYRESPPGMGR